MILFNGKIVGSMMSGGKMQSILVYSGKVVWQAVRSCFGAGYWRGDKPWIGSDGWKG
jgi:hypothetical protein